MSHTNNFIIGLGGVGGKAIAAFRRTVAVRDKDADKLEKKGVKFEYLYVDSNDDILHSDIWTVYGKKIALAPSDVVQLKNSGVIPSIKEIANHPNICDWIGDLSSKMADRKKTTGDKVDQELRGLSGAGQLRRYGRALFALNVNRVRTTILTKIQQLVNGREEDISFSIFATLGGGTGSGCIIDMVTMLKDICKEQGRNACVYLYVFVAGSAAEASDTGSFYENEYAALRDINALMTDSFHPYIVGKTARSNQGNDFNIPTPIQTVYLSTEVCPGGPVIDEQVEYMSKACFDAIIYRFSFVNPNCLRALSGEDLVDVNPGEPDMGKVSRSYRFAAFGARRWCVPTQQIRELLKLELERRVLTSWIYGTPLPRNSSRDTSNLDGVVFNLESTATFKELYSVKQNLLQSLKAYLENVDQHSKRGSDTLTQLAALGDRIVNDTAKLFNDTNTLLRFARCYQEDAAHLSNVIQGAIDQKITWKFVGDVWGVQDVSKYLAGFIQQIAAAGQGKVLSEAQRIDQDRAIQDNMRLREKEWSKLGPLTIHLTQLDERMIQWHGKDVESRVNLALSAFRDKVRENLCTQVSQSIGSLRNRVNRAMDDLISRVQIVEGLTEKVSHGLQQNANRAGFGDVYEYDKENLDKVRHQMAEQHRAHQEEMATVYSEQWNAHIGSLGKYDSKQSDILVHAIQANLFDSSKTLHDLVTSQGSCEPVLLASIFARLHQIAGPQKDTWEDRIGGKVRAYLQNLGASTHLQGSGLMRPQKSPTTAIVFGLPSSTGSNAEFVEWLKQELKSSLPTAYNVLPGRMDIFEHETPDEIRVLYMPYWFPARFAPVVETLYNRYNASAQLPGGESVIYFANIDQGGEKLNSPSRPPLTEAGEPDFENEKRVKLAEQLFVSVGDRKKYLVDASDSNLVRILASIDEDGIAEYHNEFPDSMRSFPSQAFKEALSWAYELAAKAMTEADKRAVYDVYTERVLTLEDRGYADSSPEMIQAKEDRQFVRRELGI